MLLRRTPLPLAVRVREFELQILYMLRGNTASQLILPVLLRACSLSSIISHLVGLSSCWKVRAIMDPARARLIQHERWGLIVRTHDGR